MVSHSHLGTLNVKGALFVSGGRCLDPQAFCQETQEGAFNTQETEGRKTWLHQLLIWGTPTVSFMQLKPGLLGPGFPSMDCCRCLCLCELPPVVGKIAPSSPGTGAQGPPPNSICK